MGKKYIDRDPTANAAIGNVDRDRKYAARKPSQARRLLDEFPDIFDGLLPHEAREVALRAHHIAGNDVHAITRHHLESALRAVRQAAR